MRAALLALSCLGLLACAEEKVAPVPDPKIEALGRCKDFNPERNVYFGDLHVHTSLSLDANLQGNRVSVADAYRFARSSRSRSTSSP